MRKRFSKKSRRPEVLSGLDRSPKAHSMESAAVSFVPKLLAPFHAEHPEIALKVQTAVSKTCLTKVINGELYGAFVAVPTKPQNLNRFLYAMNNWFYYIARETQQLRAQNSYNAHYLYCPKVVHIAVFWNAGWQI